MGKKKIDETRYIELNIPQEMMVETAEIIEENEIDATIVGKTEDEDSITVGFDYSPNQRESIMEILELIEDHNSDEGEEEEEETEED